jgi:hypothetical protein
MQPGLRRMTAAEPHLHPLAAGSALWHEKQAVVQARQAVHCAPGFDASDAINSIATQALSTGAFSDFDSQTPLALRVAEDLAVLQADGTVPWLCVCTPSHWAPEDKLGQSLAHIHAPVADNGALLAAASGIAHLVTGGASWERWVWTIAPSDRFDQHPHRHARAPWPAADDPSTFAQGCWLRSERQTFFPVYRPDASPAQQSVFTIRVGLQPLTEAVNSAASAQRLGDALASMSDAVLAYKGLDAARAPLLQWLRQPGFGSSLPRVQTDTALQRAIQPVTPAGEPMCTPAIL